MTIERVPNENPRWTACRAELGRDPKGWEFVVWNSNRWRDFASTIGWDGRGVASVWAFSHLWFTQKKSMDEVQELYNKWLFDNIRPPPAGQNVIDGKHHEQERKS